MGRVGVRVRVRARGRVRVRGRGRGRVRVGGERDAHVAHVAEHISQG